MDFFGIWAYSYVIVISTQHIKQLMSYFLEYKSHMNTLRKNGIGQISIKMENDPRNGDGEIVSL